MRMSVRRRVSISTPVSSLRPWFVSRASGGGRSLVTRVDLAGSSAVVPPSPGPGLTWLGRQRLSRRRRAWYIIFILTTCFRIHIWVILIVLGKAVILIPNYNVLIQMISLWFNM